MQCLGLGIGAGLYFSPDRICFYSLQHNQKHRERGQNNTRGQGGLINAGKEFNIQKINQRAINNLKGLKDQFTEKVCGMGREWVNTRGFKKKWHEEAQELGQAGPQAVRPEGSGSQNGCLLL